MQYKATKYNFTKYSFIYTKTTKHRDIVIKRKHQWYSMNDLAWRFHFQIFFIDNRKNIWLYPEKRNQTTLLQ
jgi:hypothetical protein